MFLNVMGPCEESVCVNVIKHAAFPIGFGMDATRVPSGSRRMTSHNFDFLNMFCVRCTVELEEP